jgi:hypothetical protein
VAALLAAFACGDSSSDGAAPVADAGDEGVLPDGAQPGDDSGSSDSSACSSEACSANPTWCGVHTTTCGQADCGPCHFRQDDLGKGQWLAVSVAADGTIDVVFYRDATRTIVHSSALPPAAFQEETIGPIVPAGLGSPAFPRPQIARDASGVLHVVYATIETPDGGAAVSTVKHAVKKSGTWTIDTVGVGQNPSIAIDKKGRTHVLVAARSGATCVAGACALTYYVDAGSGFQPTVVGSAKVVSIAALAVDAKDDPVAAFIDNATGEVSYATPNGAAWQITPIAPAGTASTGLPLAIAVGGATTHVVFDGKQSAGTPPLVHLANSGSGFQTDTIGKVEQDFALSLGAGGQPHVAYFAFDQYHGLRFTSLLGSSWSSENVTRRCDSGRVALDGDTIAYTCSSGGSDDDIFVLSAVGPYPPGHTAACAATGKHLCDLATACSAQTGTACYSIGSGHTCWNGGACDPVGLGQICGEATEPPDLVTTCQSTMDTGTCGPSSKPGDPNQFNVPAACDSKPPP